DRLLHFGCEGFEITNRDQNPCRFETRSEPTRQAAAIKGVRALGGDLLETPGEVGLHNRSAERRWRTVGEKNRGAARIGSERRPILLGEMAVAACDAEALAGQGNRLGEQV